MRQLLSTLRRAPATLVGVLVALTAASAMVTIVASLAGTAETMAAPVQRLAASSIVVIGDQHVRFTSGHGENKVTTSLPLTAYRRVPDDLADRLAHVPGVRHVVADVSVPLGVQGPRGIDAAATGHGWSSSVLTPFRLSAGHRPDGPRQLVLSAPLARTLHVGVGDSVRIDGRDRAAYTVAGVATAPSASPATESAVFLSDAVAARLYGHPGQADLLAVLPAPAARPGLAARVAAEAGSGVTVLTGADRDLAEDVGATGDKDNLSDFAIGAGIPVVLVSLFVVAGAVGLSVAGRRRLFALLRAVGATPGQVRRRIAGELAVLGLVGGLLGYPLGTALAGIAVDGLIGHGLLPQHTTRWTAWFVLLIACGAGVVVSQLAGFVAGWRAGRADPVLALREASSDRRWPNPLRLLLGLAALGGGVTLSVFTFGDAQNPTDEINLALTTLLTFVAATAFLGPVLVSLVELLVRVPARLIGGPGARLALADIRRRPRRIASAVVAVALSVGFLGTVYLVNATALHADVAQNRDRLLADSVIAAPNGLSPQAIAPIDQLAGVTAAVGITSTTVFLPSDGGTSVAAAGLTRGSVPAVLKLGVIAGQLERIGPGQIALSQLSAGKVKVGASVRVYLADGTPYRARVVAIFNRGLGFADAVVPIDAAGGGHLGTTTLTQVLVRGRLTTHDVAGLAARFPGLSVRASAVANADAKRLDEQSQYLNTLIVALIGLLAAVTLVNTLVTATVERRESLRLLDRVGATGRQLMAMAGWQAMTVGAIGMLCGIASGGAALIAVTKALTGDWHPYIPVPAAVGIGAGIIGLTAVAILGPTAAILRSTRAES